jgi:hypothetical protein
MNRNQLAGDNAVSALGSRTFRYGLWNSLSATIGGTAGEVVPDVRDFPRVI